MKAPEYDAWYESPRGQWIGETEYRLLSRVLAQREGQTLLDVGCGTGWFTRKFASLEGATVVGVDSNADWIEYARRRDPHSDYLVADARCLPFADNTFDAVASIAALCFIDDWPLALREMVRVARGNFAVATLNRASLLWRQKGRGGGSGAYRGAYWHRRSQLRSAFAELAVADLRFESAVFLPSGSRIARLAEALVPASLPWGALLVAAGRKLHTVHRFS